MEIPTARVLNDGQFRFGYAQANPYIWYTGGLGLLPGLEFSGRFTEISNIQTTLGGGAYGTYKDKALDLKYQIIAESKYFPALAIGLHDFHGTVLFPAEYLVASRQIFPLDFTIGLGSKRLKGPLSFFDDFGGIKISESQRIVPGGLLQGGVGFFGGVEWAINKRFHLMAEYNPIEYEKDKASARGVPQGASSPINVGLRAKLLPGIDLSISYQRGDTLGFMVNLQGMLGRPVLPKSPDPPAWGIPGRIDFSKTDIDKMVTTTRLAIEKAGFYNVSVYTDGGKITAEFENDKYLSYPKAAGRVLRILLFHAPRDTTRLAVIIKKTGIKLLKVSIKPAYLDAYLTGQISAEMVDSLIQVETLSTDTEKTALAKSEHKPHFDYFFGVKPGFDTFLNDPSGVFKYRLGVQPFAVADLWTGASAFVRYDIPLYSSISSSNDAPADSVRSDSWKYLDSSPRFDRAVLNQTVKLGRQTFMQLRGGVFDRMYVGAGGELLTFIADGRLALGIEGDWVRKRAVESQFELLEVEKYSLLANVYYYFAPLALTLNAKYGRFLGGDMGWRLTVQRQYDTGAVVGAWYSFTDTDVFNDSFNRGYHDKGIFVQLPLRMFTDYESNRKYHYSISPWTRDVAQTINHWQNLYDLCIDLMPVKFKATVRDLKK